MLWEICFEAFFAIIIWLTAEAVGLSFVRPVQVSNRPDGGKYLIKPPTRDLRCRMDSRELSRKFRSRNTGAKETGTLIVVPAVSTDYVMGAFLAACFVGVVFANHFDGIVQALIVDTIYDAEQLTRAQIGAIYFMFVAWMLLAAWLGRKVARSAKAQAARIAECFIRDGYAVHFNQSLSIHEIARVVKWAIMEAVAEHYLLR